MEHTNQKNNIFSIISFIILIINVFIMLFWQDINKINLYFIICLILSLITITLSIIAIKKIKKTNEKGKNYAIISLILSILILIWSILDIIVFTAIKDIKFNDQVICSEVNKCIDNLDGTSTCLFTEFEVKCTTEFLNESQFKDNENKN